MWQIARGHYVPGLVVTLFGLLVAQQASAEPFATKRLKLLDPCGQQVVIRGVNAGIAFPSDPTASKLSEVAQTGANSVRLTFRWLINQSDPTDVKTALQKASENHLLAIPSIWDSYGDWFRLPFSVDFWTQPEMVSVLRQYEDAMLLNISNEAGDGTVSQADYLQGYIDAVVKMRLAGLHMPLVIDAAGVGRDESYILENAKTLISKDPDHNLIFSWHPWDTAQPQSRYNNFINEANRNWIPIMLGEFADVGANYAGTIDYQYLLQLTAQYKIGWLWWWWASGNTVDKHAMTTDGVYGNWANVGEEVALTNPYGISETSKAIGYLANHTCNGQSVVTAVPNAPSNLTATSTVGAEVALSWKDNSNNEKNFDIEVWDETSKSWRLTKVVGRNTREAKIGAGAEFVYSINDPMDTSLNYSTTYQIRVGAYRTRDAIAYSEPVTVTTKDNPSVCSNGNGLTGDYYRPPYAPYQWNGMIRTDPQVDFDWGQGSPDPSDPSVPSDYFEVAWYGDIEPQFDGEYTFYTNSDDYARVWIDGQLVIDNWRTNAKGWGAGKVSLQAGTRYYILVEHRENSGYARMSLQWASKQLKREVVPQCRLFTTE